MCTETTGTVPPVDVVRDDAEWRGEPIRLEPVDELSILTVCDNTVDIFLTDQGPAQRLLSRMVGSEPELATAPMLVPGKVIDAPLAEHGFSTLVTMRRGEQMHRILFDTGITPNGCRDNLRRMGVDPGDVEAIVCSHGHFDHTTGMSGLAEQLGRRALPVILHPEFWTRRRINFPGPDVLEVPSTSRRALEGAGFDIVEQRWPSFLFERSLLITGEVDRTSDFERGFPIHEAQRNGDWEPDPLILDDQALIAHVAGRGLVVLSGCGHAGIVNTVRYAQRLTGVDDVHAVMGGFHLTGPLFEPIIDPTLTAFERLQPDWLIPSHCTGWKAIHAAAARFPEAFVQNSVGTRMVFTADHETAP